MSIYKKILASAIVTVNLTCAQVTAQQQIAPELKVPRVSAAEAQKKSVVVRALGPIKLGMTLSSVQSLRPKGDIYLSTILVSDEVKGAPASHQWFSSKLVSPLTEAPAPIHLNFESGILVHFMVELDEFGTETAEQQLWEKYGKPGATFDKQTVPCTYENGVSFNRTESTVRRQWAGNLVLIQLTSRLKTSCPVAPQADMITGKWASYLTFTSNYGDMKRQNTRNVF